MKPLCIDLFCGLGGWTEGFLAEGYDVVGFDIEQHVYGEDRYPGMLAIQDVLTLHGSQFRKATAIVASPPCQRYSYMAMPWTRAKAKAEWYRDPAHPERIAELNALFDACFRIQREASEAAGQHIPLIVENVKGAQAWVGRAPWHYGSFYLWGDIPALMPMTSRTLKSTGGSWFLDGSSSIQRNDPRDAHLDRAIKNDGGSWFAVAHNTTSGHAQNPDGRKGVGGSWLGDNKDHPMRRGTSKGMARKAASARIAKIPFELARYIAHVYRPAVERAA